MKASFSKMKKQAQRGFTLVEIAIVLVIIGLLIGGVLRGQELLNSARVNSIAAQQSSISTAYYGFIDRYKALPGDMTAAQVVLINSTTAPASAGGDGNVLLADSPAFFNNLAQAGFLTCTPCSSTTLVTPGAAGAAATYITPAGITGTNTMVNVYGQPLAFLFNTGATTGSTAVVGSSTAQSINFLASTAEITKPLLVTGGQIASNMLAELDRKADDGNPAGGSFRYTDISATTIANPFVTSAVSGACFTATGTPATYAWAVNPPGICQGVSMF